MQILAIVSGEYGERHVANVRQNAPDTWATVVWQAPALLPPVIDYPEDYVPEQMPPADLLLSFAEHKGVAELSKGFRQRVGLAITMIHDPDILILDEPTTGLDPSQIIEIRELIKRIGTEKTVILSTHILPEVEATSRSFEVMLNYIRGTTTKAGLEVKAILLDREYEKGVRISDQQMDALNLHRRRVCPRWNYVIKPCLASP